MEEEVLVFGLCTINGELQITQIKNSQSIDEKFHWRGNEAKVNIHASEESAK